MKIKNTVVSTILAGIVLVAVWATPCKAQSEVDPDHFEMNNVEPLPQPHAKLLRQAEQTALHFRGKFRLPYNAECAGKRLLPGHYSLSLHSDGKIARARLIHQGQTMEFAGVVRIPAPGRKRDALFVECIGKTHRLSVIHVEELDFVISPDPQAEPTSDGKPKQFEKLPLVRGGSET